MRILWLEALNINYLV